MQKVHVPGVANVNLAPVQVENDSMRPKVVSAVTTEKHMLYTRALDLVVAQSEPFSLHDHSVRKNNNARAQTGHDDRNQPGKKRCTYECRTPRKQTKIVKHVKHQGRCNNWGSPDTELRECVATLEFKKRWIAQGVFRIQSSCLRLEERNDLLTRRKPGVRPRAANLFGLKWRRMIPRTATLPAPDAFDFFTV